MLHLSLFLLGGVVMTADTVRIEHHRFEGPAGSRTYRVAIPAVRDPAAVVLVLHGCLQHAEDIARGTRLDQQAAGALRWLVVYPEQPATAHPNRCWNWYDPDHQQRGAGEPAMVMGILDEVMQGHAPNGPPVFVVGVSAGGGMAVNLAALYPERFAGVGVHSGVPAFAAGTLPTALDVMKGTQPDSEPAAIAAVLTAMAGGRRALPLLVIHGERDAVLSPTNADRLVAQFRGVASATGGRVPITRTIIPGLGHAWSGGDPAGSFTDPTTPDATRMFLDFFAGLLP